MSRRPSSRPRRPQPRTSAARTRARRLLVAPAAAALVLGLGACSATNPMTTMQEYAASDGVRFEIDEVRLGNLFVVSAAEGEPGNLVGQVTNDGAERTTVRIAAGTDEVSVRVGPGETVLIGPAGEQLVLATVPAPPGAYAELAVSTDRGTVTAQVPVLDGTLPEYADLVPTGEADEG